MVELKIGQTAPSFDLPVDGGGSFRLAELRGKFVVLYFYPKDDTTACTAEAIDFSRLAPEFERAGAVVIGLSPDSGKKHDRFKAKHALTIPLVADEERRAIDAYGLWVEKLLYGRKYMGVERATFLIGPDGKILHIWRKVKVRDHAQQVLDALKAL